MRRGLQMAQLPDRSTVLTWTLGATLWLWLPLAPLSAAEAPVFSDCRLESAGGTASVRARCTTLAVPLDHAAPEGRQISLQVAVAGALAAHAAADPVVLLSGGPGQSASESLVELRHLFRGLRERRDIVVVDQRGTGASSPLECPGFEGVDDPFALRADTSLAMQRLARCREQLAADPRYFSSDAAVKDLEAVRRALGYEQFNLYGFSYGTRVAQLYAARYPEHTRSVVMDAVLPLGVALGATVADSAAQVIASELTRCSDDAACAGALPELTVRYQGLLETLAAAPREVSFEHPRTGETLRMPVDDGGLQRMLRLLSYQPETRSMLPLLVHRAAAGRLAPLVALAHDFEYGLERRINWLLHLSVLCREDLPHISAPVRERSRELQNLARACEVWDVPAREPFAETLPASVPVLLLSGEYDPVTPRAPVAALAEGHDNRLAVTAPGQGHIVSIRGCLPERVQAFIETPEPARLDMACVQQLAPPPPMLNLNAPRP